MDASDPECDANNNYTNGNPDCVHIVGIAALAVYTTDIESNSATGRFVPAMLPLAPIDPSHGGNPDWPQTVRLVEPGVVVTPPTPAPTPTAGAAPTPTVVVPTPTAVAPAPVIGGASITLHNGNKNIQARPLDHGYQLCLPAALARASAQYQSGFGASWQQHQSFGYHGQPGARFVSGLDYLNG